MVRHMILVVFILTGLSVLGQTTTHQEIWTFNPSYMPGSDYPEPPVTGDIRCWKDTIVDHFMCMNSNGTVIDVERELDKTELETTWGSEGNGGGDLPIFLNQPVNVDALDDVQAEDELPYDSVDCDNANGNPRLCTIEPDEPDWGTKANGSCIIGNSGFLAQTFNEAAQRAADDTDGKTRQLTKPEALERLDVPAVLHENWQEHGSRFYTCTDKSRVLLTSEDGEKWCHKVQP